MKNTLFALITLVFFVGHSFGQNKSTGNQKTKLLCITTSCCSLVFFTVEVWSQTTCHYVESNRMSMILDNDKNLDKIEVIEDVLLAGHVNNDGENLVLPKGVYDIENNEINFTPSTFKAKKYCYVMEAQGVFLGHEYEYSITICISFGRNSNKGIVVVTPKLTNAELNQILSSKDKTIVFNEDTVIKRDNIDFTLKAGEYIVNEDGNIYLQHVLLK